MQVIGISANCIDPELTRGRVDGIGVYTQSMLREMPRLGFSCRPVYAPRVLPRAQRTGSAIGFRYPLAAGIATNALFGGAMPGAGRVESTVDLYHATDYLVPRLRRTPVVATFYDAIPHSRAEWANPRLRALKNWVMLRAAKNADRIIVVSRAAAAEVIRVYGVSEERLRVVHLGIDTVWPTAPSAERVAATLTRYGLRAGYFLFVGTLQPRKNLALLMTAFERLEAGQRRDRQLVIAGRYGWGMDALREALLRRRGEGAVVWVDHVDDLALRDLYAGAGCFVFPSLAEGFGLPVLEALGAGLPVIASDLEVLREVTGGIATFVPADNERAWTGALAAAPSADDPAATAARVAWARRSSWEDCARNTAEVYRELL